MSEFDDIAQRSCIHELIEYQAERTPESVALLSENRQVTYGELNARANQMAHHLRKHGAAPEAFVGICLERSLDAAIALLGILKSGAAYVYLDPAHPAKRLDDLIRDCQPRCVVTSAPLKRLFADESVCIDVSSPLLSNEVVSNPRSGVQIDNAACVLYTSGSTGKPKGVVEIHRSLTARLTSGQLPDILAGDVCCLNSSLGFGITASRLFLPLAIGLAVVILSDEDVEDTVRFAEALERNCITSIFLSPAHLRTILTLDEKILRRLHKIRAVSSGGASLTAELVRSFFRALPDTVLVNIYGSAEIGTTSNLQVVGRTSVSDLTLIGAPVANATMHLLDENLAEVSPGAIGEMCVGAAHLARGYLNRPDLTAEKFVQDPFKPGSRLYRTGDLGRLLPTGEIQFLGRRDHQVKIRGVRVELGEVEAVIEEHPAVQETAVTAQDFSDDKRLIAYFVTKGGVSLSSTALRRFLADRLPAQLIPSAFVRLAKMPRTLTGKVDRNALPACDSRPEVDIPYEAPNDEIEARLNYIWCIVLELSSVGVNDNYFDLGGDSSLSVRLFSEINREFKSDLPLATLFHAPTVRSVARILRGAGVREVRSAIVPIQPKGTRPPVFCIGGAGGEVILFRRLALELGEEQPLYGLQPFGLAAYSPVLLQVEKIAAHYIQQIQAARHDPPQCLIGNSFGGLVAIEMARQLSEAGQPVAAVVLIDTPNPANKKVHGRIKRWRYHLGLDHLQVRFGRPYFRLVQKAAAAVGPRPANRSLNIHNMLVYAGSKYRANLYGGRVYIFRAASGEALESGPSLGWEGVLSDLVLVDVPGDHRTIVSGRNLKILSEELVRCLPAFAKSPL